jgi:hypothetical protein
VISDQPGISRKPSIVIAIVAAEPLDCLVGIGARASGADRTSRNRADFGSAGAGGAVSLCPPRPKVQWRGPRGCEKKIKMLPALI